jgi:hypothetical protein
MTEIVHKMRGELRDILRDSVVDYTTKARDKWLFDWPSQIILVVNQVFWCQEVEQVCGPGVHVCVGLHWNWQRHTTGSSGIAGCTDQTAEALTPPLFALPAGIPGHGQGRQAGHDKLQ